MEDELPFECEYEDEEYNCVRAAEKDVNDFFLATLGVPFRDTEAATEAEKHRIGRMGFYENGNVYVDYSDANIWARILRAEKTGEGKYTVTAVVASAYDGDVIEAALKFDAFPIEGYPGFRAEERAWIGARIIDPGQVPGTLNSFGCPYAPSLQALMDELDALDAEN